MANEDQVTFTLDEPVVGKVPDKVARSFKAAARRAGLPDELRFHDTRHTWSSWLQTRCSYACLQALMGHSPGKSVTLAYTHPTWEEKLAAVEHLPRILTPDKATEAQTY